jgi:hypothetical protein
MGLAGNLSVSSHVVFNECVLLEESYIPEKSCFVFEVSKSPE